jgi:hypothetical protein
MVIESNKTTQFPGNEGSGMLSRMSGFIGRHRLLSSFLCLMIAPSLADCFIYLYSLTGYHWGYNFGERMTDAVVFKLISLTPIFLISLLLSTFLPIEKATGRPAFATRFTVSTSVAFITIQVFVVVLYPAMVSGATWRTFYGPYWLENLIIETLSASVYSAVFGLFFGSQTQASIGWIIFQSSIITFLILHWYGLFYIASMIVRTSVH